jgi:hypothetical protein
MRRGKTRTLDLSMQPPTGFETVLEGRWRDVDGRLSADETASRIDELVRGHFVVVADAEGGWSTLHRDPVDGRLWELTYPHSEMHGGGPAKIEVVSVGAARAKYGAVVEV